MYSIISVDQILEDYGYSYDTIDEYNTYIINTKICDLFKSQIKSKRNRGIIYSNTFITETTLCNLKDVLCKYDKVTDIVLLDDANAPKLRHLYDSFEEIIYFPSAKKIRLTESQSFVHN
ncbi:MAG: hypothetical protein ACRDD8_14215 [Bacteroidales bacterium]